MNHTYRYPPVLRAPALFVSLLAGGILLGSVIAEIEAADVPDAILHGAGMVAGIAMLWLGLEFGMRRITPTREDISTRLLRERTIPWREVRDVRDGPFGVLIIQPKRGLPIVIWPYLEDFSALLEAVTNFSSSSTPSTS
ncbi:MAG TPA: hypothetical protein VFL17_23190 [Anaerolineae bacterium]|nr:hypothetical protein [Anaerolineae bacterium]